MEPGTAFLLGLTMSFQMIVHLIRQLQVHAYPVTDMHLWSKLCNIRTQKKCCRRRGQAEYKRNKPKWKRIYYLVNCYTTIILINIQGCKWSVVKRWQRSLKGLALYPMCWKSSLESHELKLTLSMRAVFLRPQTSSSCFVVMFLPFPTKPFFGVVVGFSVNQTKYQRHMGFSVPKSCNTVLL